MSYTEKVMVYFAVATLHFYRGDLVTVEYEGNPRLFIEKNQAVIETICGEARRLYGIKLSQEQIYLAVDWYLVPSRSEGRHAVSMSTVS